MVLKALLQAFEPSKWTSLSSDRTTIPMPGLLLQGCSTAPALSSCTSYEDQLQECAERYRVQTVHGIFRLNNVWFVKKCDITTLKVRYTVNVVYDSD